MEQRAVKKYRSREEAISRSPFGSSCYVQQSPRCYAPPATQRPYGTSRCSYGVPPEITHNGGKIRRCKDQWAHRTAVMIFHPIESSMDYALPRRENQRFHAIVMENSMWLRSTSAPQRWRSRRFPNPSVCHHRRVAISKDPTHHGIEGSVQRLRLTSRQP